MVNEKQMTDCIVLVLAAGTGSRTSNSAPKQYILLNRKAMLRRTVEIFLTHPAITAIHVVISKGHKEFYKNAIDGLDLPPPIYGGDTRQQSALKGLIHLKDKQPKYVLIHDAARPFVDHKLIDRVLNKLITNRVAIPGIRLTDTLKRVRAAHRNVENTARHDRDAVGQGPFADPQRLRTGYRMNGAKLDDARSVTALHVIRESRR